MLPSSENIKVVLQNQLTNDQKIESLSAKDTLSEEEYDYARLINLVERCKKVAKPVDDGIDPLTRPHTQPANYQSDRLKIVETTEGNILMDLLIYSPSDLSYGCSVYVRWQLDRDGQSRTVLEEYLSDKSFIKDTAAHRADAPKLLSLLEESLAAYEQAAGL